MCFNFVLENQKQIKLKNIYIHKVKMKSGRSVANLTWTLKRSCTKDFFWLLPFKSPYNKTQTLW